MAALSTRVDLPLGQVLQVPHAKIDYCYFIETGMVSKVAPLADGEPIEVGMVGSEGMVGLAALLGADRSPLEAIVQLAGTALRIDASALVSRFDKSLPLRRVILPYVQAMMVQISQTAACNGRHEAPQRLARWLLIADDKYVLRPLPLTQEYLGMMLGVRRQQITIAATILQRAGVISYSHGQIAVTDRLGLEGMACECYGVVAREFTRLLDRPRSASQPE